MKSYTNIEQSKKLAEILPIDSADMNYATWTILENGEFIVSPNRGNTIKELQEDYGIQIIPCWSLAALLSVIPNVSINEFEDNKWYVMIIHNGKMIYGDKDNPIDACYELMLKLHEEKLL